MKLFPIFLEVKNTQDGLKKSTQTRVGRFTMVMTHDNFRIQSKGDHTLFIKHSYSMGVIVLLVCVDDNILNDWKEQQLLNQHLAKEFEIRTLGRLKYLWGLKWPTPKKGIFISHQNKSLICLRYSHGLEL